MPRSFFASGGKKAVNRVSLRVHEKNALYLRTGRFGPGTAYRRNWRIRSLYLVPVYDRADVGPQWAGKRYYHFGGAVHPLLGAALFFPFFCVFIRERHLSFSAKLFAHLFSSYAGGWHGIILRCLGDLSAARLMVDLGPGIADFTVNCNTLLVESLCTKRANGVS